MLDEPDRFLLVTSLAARISVERTPVGVVISVDDFSAELSLPETRELAEALDRLGSRPSEGESTEVEAEA